MAAEVMQQARLERMSGEDFETASIRSAAPSYVSDTPSYHSTLPPSEPPPSYSRPVPPSHVMLASTPAQSRQRNAGVGSSSTSMLPPATSNTLRGPGLPPIPDTPTFSQMPQLSQFRIPSWSSLSSNPQARHYQAVANRRVSRDTGRGGSSGGGGDRPAPYNTHHHLPHHHHHHQQVLRTTLERVAEDHERERVRPLEDPYLVGEEAAARARRERLARENADEILIQENRRWDLFLAQMKDWNQRSESWKQFESRRRGRQRRW